MLKFCTQTILKFCIENMLKIIRNIQTESSKKIDFSIIVKYNSTFCRQITNPYKIISPNRPVCLQLNGLLITFSMD